MTMDYAGNASYMYITMSAKEEMVELDADQVNLMEGDSMRIHQLYRFDANTPVDCPLTWTTDNADVVSIGEHTTEYADIQAKAPGTATVTATNSYGISDRVTIRVVETGDPNYATVVFDPGTFGALNGRGRMVLPGWPCDRGRPGARGTGKPGIHLQVLEQDSRGLHGRR